MAQRDSQESIMLYYLVLAQMGLFDQVNVADLKGHVLDKAANPFSPNI